MDIDQCVRDLGISERTIYYHLDKLNEKNIVFRVYKGTRKPNELAMELLHDTGMKLRGIGSLYYFPMGNVDSQLKKDIAVLKYCFGWQEGYIKHYQRWSNADCLTYEDNSDGISKVTEEHLLLFFQYVVHGKFEWNHEKYDCYMDRFERVTAC